MAGLWYINLNVNLRIKSQLQICVEAAEALSEDAQYCADQGSYPRYYIFNVGQTRPYSKKKSHSSLHIPERTV